MNVATFDEPRQLARQKYAEYLRACKQRHTAEYQALKNAYRELSRGRQVIDLTASIKQGGVDELGRPRLACIRADVKACWIRRWDSDGGRVRFGAHRDAYYKQPKPTTAIDCPPGTLPALGPTNRGGMHRAIVPTIPPALLPAGDLKRYHILWEADWEQVPVDPMLLRSLGKGLYVVLAAWDLTPLERAVLGASTP